MDARRGGWIVALALVASALGAAPAAAGAHLVLVPRHTAVGGPLRVEVVLVSSVSLGAYTAEASFDPQALDLIGIRGGSTPEFSGPPLVGQGGGRGKVRFSAFQAVRLDGPSGRVSVATLEFRRLQLHTRTRLGVRVEKLAAADGTTYPVRARGRTLRLRSP